ncbi:DNA topoisomerase 1 [Zea mays]|uniref:DNA topoisomerase n=1 Tax=Zea mays TaxID=4577 RepID=A0A3L6EB55_MAIZE|nr:DNA topoisomerase 1 [Zea mays]
MALQLRRLLPHGYAQRHRAVIHALSLLPPPPAMLQFEVFQRYSSSPWPFSPFRPCKMCGVAFRSNSTRKISSRNNFGVALQPKSSAFITPRLFGSYSSVCFRATASCGIALKANSIGNSRPFSTTYSKKIRFLVKNKISFSNLNMRRKDGSVAHSLLHRSEKCQSTLATCSTIVDEASTSTSNNSKSVTDAKTDTAKRKSSRGSKKEVDGDMKEKEVHTNKKRIFARTRKAATKTSDNISTNQENKKTDNCKLKRGADSFKEKKVNNRAKSKAEVSAASSVPEICMQSSIDGSVIEKKPLVPLYPPRAKSVVVVESATKAKVIQKYLGDMYEVLPSYGHVRDLAGRSKSVRPDDDFSMVWEVPAAAWTHLKSIKVALQRAENLILASDPDREGEAIAWHIKEMLEQQGVLGFDVTVARVVFHEISEDAIKKALMSPRYIDMDLVNAYLARRSLDYLIGFGISPLLWRKLPGCQSAGRVQSAALALVCDREAEIEQFKAHEYWTVQTDFKIQSADPSNATCIPFCIKHLNSKKLDQLSIPSQEEAQAIEKMIHSSTFEVLGVKRSKIHKNPPLPYITSSLQQDAANKLHFTAGYTMKIAQNLYEGINLSSEETTGLITYIRTDGFHISDGAVEDIRSLVKERYGQKYVSEDIRKYLKKVKNAQEAHEAIRPTSIRRSPSSLVGILDDDSLKLYTLIWKRTMACQMEASRTEMVGYSRASFFYVVDFILHDDNGYELWVYKVTLVKETLISLTWHIQVDVGIPEGEMNFHSTASKLDFKGYRAVYEGPIVSAIAFSHLHDLLLAIRDDQASPCIDSSEGDCVHECNFEALSKLMVAVKDLVFPVNVHLGQHFTKPPPRYSEGALIKKLEELGIGRPSTYASIMKVLLDRKYVTAKSRVLHPEFRGRMVSAFLLHHFSEVSDYNFTANMETELDNVSAGSTEWKGLLKDYWERFSKYCADVSKLDGRKVERMLEEKFGPILFSDVYKDCRICPSCSEGTLRFKVSRYGEGYFVGCDRHPKCKYIARSLSQQEDETEPIEENAKSFEPRLLGVMPDSDQKVFLKQGPYGYYVQVGEDKKGLFPKRASLSKVKDIDSVTLEDAIELLQYPKILGKHPEDDNLVLITHSKVGYNIKHRRFIAQVPKNMDPKKMTLERALKLLSSKSVRRIGRLKGKVEKKKPIEWH